jgi:dissimilatory sulfite reductase (desulfoviridin) alpha/beta subunit
MTRDRNRDRPKAGRRTPAAPAPAGPPQPDYAALKAGGMIRQRQKDRFTVRLRCPGGRMPLDRLARILEVARRYGADYAHLSVRQSIEIPYVHTRDLGAVKAELAEAGQEIATCGARVRAPTACAGCEYNPRGLTDTQGLVREVAERFFGRSGFGHKFKMALSGCPNDCTHTSANDLGFQGAVEPEWVKSLCTGCGLCAQACREGAIVQPAGAAYPRWLRRKCLFCGDCIRSCPTDAWRARRTGWMVRAGGRHGRHPITGAKIGEFLPDRQVPELIEAVLAWYRRAGEGRGRIRLGDLLLESGAWGRFVADLEPVLGEWAVRDPPPPRPAEIHFQGTAARGSPKR